MTRLFCTRLTLSDFRNHAALDLILEGRPVCLHGANGAGKTNILEALTMLAPGRGLRGAGLTEIARGGGDNRVRLWSVSGRFRNDGNDLTIGAGAERSDSGVKRVMRLDGEPATASELARALRISWLTPAMDRLFSGAASDRRRFFDRLVLARAPEHGAAAVAYERSLRERQRLLTDGGADPAWLTALEREIAQHGCAIAAARADTRIVLQAAIDVRPGGAFPQAVLAIEGPLEASFEAGAASADLEEQLQRALHRNRARDAAAGRTLEGPHRSDLLVRHREKDMPADLCSTGEQKALLLGLVLAHGHALAHDPGPALLLLDEAGAHLDPARRSALYEELLDLPGQAWLTGTEPGLFEAFADRAQLVEV